MVCFDLLAAGGIDLRSRPLHERWARLEEVLSGMGPPIALCQQTDDEPTAAQWLETLTVAGIEGLVVKAAGSPYPTRPDRVWHKLKARETLELVCTAVAGGPAEPTLLLVSAPVGDGQLRSAGATGRLSRSAAREVGRLLEPTWESERRFPGGPPGMSSSSPLDAAVVKPLIVEVSADVATDGGVLRHPPRLLRARPDLTVEDLTDVV